MKFFAFLSLFWCLVQPAPQGDINGATMHAVVVGAGPVGILTAINLLQSGWKVTMIEKGSEILPSQRQKSWRVGLAAIGEEALRSVPGLVEKLRPFITSSETSNLCFFNLVRKVKAPFQAVDRNDMVMVMLKHLREMSVSQDFLRTCFNCHVRYINAQQKEVVFDNGLARHQVIGYDLLVGADGARSVVRNNLFSTSNSYQCAQSDIFSSIKSVYIKSPALLETDQMYLFPDLVKGGDAITIPSGEGWINFIIFVKHNEVLDDEFLSKNLTTFCTYMNKRNRLFQLSYESCSKVQESDWYQSQQVTCSPYVLDSSHGSAVLVGDAAHASSPSMGMGLNTGLNDATALVRLLNLNFPDVDQALNLYQIERLKVGHALTFMSFNLIPLSKWFMIWQQGKNMLRQYASWLTSGYLTPPAGDSSFEKQWHADQTLQQSLKQSNDIIDTARFNADVVRTHQWQGNGLLPHTKVSQRALEQRQSMLTGRGIYELTQSSIED